MGIFSGITPYQNWKNNIRPFVNRSVVKHKKPDSIRPVKSIPELISLSRNRQAVWVPLWEKKTAAAWFVSWQARLLQGWIDEKRIYKINKGRKHGKKNTRKTEGV